MGSTGRIAVAAMAFVKTTDNEAIEAHLTDLVSPAVANQLAYYRQLGLRSRILNLPLMVAAVLSPAVL